MTAPVAPGEKLVRGMGRFDLLLLVLNAIIGAGIFGLPSRVFSATGSYSLFAYLICAVLLVLIILCFAEVSSRFDSTGGPYLYAREAFGPAVGFEIGLLLWLARFTAFAALTNGWLDYFAALNRDATTGVTRTVLICAIVTVFTVINILGVKSSSLFNNIFTIGKLVPLTIFAIVGLFFINPANFDFSNPPPFEVFAGSAVLPLMFAFTGFEMAVIPAGESRDPRKHAPFALIVGALIVVVLYMLIQIVSIGALPDLGTSTRPIADAAGNMWGETAKWVMVAGALISITGTLNTIVLVGPRLLFALGENGQLPRIFAATHSKFHTPWFAILVSSLVMLVLTLQGSFISALTISTVIRLVTYASTCVALPVLRRRQGLDSTRFIAPGGTAVAVFAVLLCVWLVSSSKPEDFQRTAIAAAIGFALYFIFNVLIKRSDPARQ